MKYREIYTHMHVTYIIQHHRRSTHSHVYFKYITKKSFFQIFLTRELQFLEFFLGKASRVSLFSALSEIIRIAVVVIKMLAERNFLRMHHDRIMKDRSSAILGWREIFRRWWEGKSPRNASKREKKLKFRWKFLNSLFLFLLRGIFRFSGCTEWWWFFICLFTIIAHHMCVVVMCERIFYWATFLRHSFRSRATTNDQFFRRDTIIARQLKPQLINSYLIITPTRSVPLWINDFKKNCINERMWKNVTLHFASFAFNFICKYLRSNDKKK